MQGWSPGRPGHRVPWAGPQLGEGDGEGFGPPGLHDAKLSAKSPREVRNPWAQPLSLAPSRGGVFHFWGALYILTGRAHTPCCPLIEMGATGPRAPKAHKKINILFIFSADQRLRPRSSEAAFSKAVGFKVN